MDSEGSIKMTFMHGSRPDLNVYSVPLNFTIYIDRLLHSIQLQCGVTFGRNTYLKRITIKQAFSI